MDFWNNPIANLSGPVFLAVYCVVGLGTSLVVWLWSHYRDNSLRKGLLEIDEDPDPLEIAYVRGGINEVIRLVTIMLIERGYLRYRDGKISRETRGSQTLRHLSKLERDVFDFYDSASRGPKDPFNDSRLIGTLEARCEAYRRFAHEEELIVPDAFESRKKWLKWFGFSVIYGLAGYKLLIAISRGRFNVLFLILLMLLFAWCVRKASTTQRLTKRGEQYIDDLRTAFRSVEGRVVDDDIHSDDPMLYLAIGVFGVAILSSAVYAAYHEMYAASYGGGGGCGAACGASCSSSGGSSCGGSSCGGGCGGGCGGCGG